MSHLYELTHEMEELMESEECDETALEKVFGDIQTKAQNICQFITILDSEAAMFQTEADRLAEESRKAD